jgi:hypothetical protein
MTKVDTGTPPSSVQKRNAVMDAVMSGEELSEAALNCMGEDTTETSTSGAPAGWSKPVTEKVELEHELYNIKFGAVDVSISEHQLAITVPATSDFKFEPKVNSHFIVKHLGQVYPVVYLGGVFQFKSAHTWAITFLIDKQQEQEHD